jgi:hypothetical protein
MFAPSVDRTLELIEGQVGQVRMKGFRPRVSKDDRQYSQNPTDPVAIVHHSLWGLRTISTFAETSSSVCAPKQYTGQSA